jgi:MinD-like ATPase involved in chromosome partitioning or flagellar assembly
LESGSPGPPADFGGSAGGYDRRDYVGYAPDPNPRDPYAPDPNAYASYDQSGYSDGALGGTSDGGSQASAVVPSTLLVGARRVHVGAWRDGSGRTTVAAGLGMAMSVNRHDRVVAVDGGPVRPGTLTVRVGSANRGVGLRELVQAGQGLTSLTDVRRFLASSAPTGLEVLPGQVDPSAPALALEEMWYALELLESWFPVVVVDAPATWNDPSSASLLLRADTMVLTTSANDVDMTRIQDVFAVLDQLGRGDLRTGAVVAVVETVPPKLTARTKRRLAQLAGRVHGAVLVPFDPALAGGRPFTWQRLRRRTRQAFEELAAAVESAPG